MKRNNKKGKQDATAFLFGAKGRDGVDGGGFANKQAGTKLQTEAMDTPSQWSGGRGERARKACWLWGVYAS